MALPEFTHESRPPQQADDHAALERIRSQAALFAAVVESTLAQRTAAIDDDATRNLVQACNDVLVGALRGYQDSIRDMVLATEAAE